LRDLLAAAPKGTKLSSVIADAFGIAGTEPAIDLDWALNFTAQHATKTRQSNGSIGELGENAIGGYYHKLASHLRLDSAFIPYCVEAWAEAKHADKDDNPYMFLHPLINRSFCLARLHGYPDSSGLRVYGCGIDIKVKGPKRAHYDIDLSLITPYLRLTGDGKAPYLGHFKQAIEEVIRKAAGAAYRNLVRPPAEMTIKDAAYEVMEEAYLKASDNEGGPRLPAKARQIMYAARPQILEMTGRKGFSDNYFIQTLLPDFMSDNEELTGNWDVVYDARGHLIEPHTGRTVPLGTVEVREYMGLRPNKPKRPQLQVSVLYPTNGPRNRFRNVLFVEKEGFAELWAAVQLAERYDLMIMSTKGLSVVAARKLLDQLAPLVDHIFVLHDFDIWGFSIRGTLDKNSHRYTFANDVSGKIIDIGLRLADVTRLALESEPVKLGKNDSREARRQTLERHGASDEEIEFLVPEDKDEECRRVELNAMTSRQLVDFVEKAFVAHGVAKVIPNGQIIEQQARHYLENKLAGDLIAKHAEAIAARAAAAELPADLVAQVERLLKEEPALSWDQALVRLV
jgi:hypothetical protein